MGKTIMSALIIIIGVIVIATSKYSALNSSFLNEYIGGPTNINTLRWVYVSAGIAIIIIGLYNAIG